MSQDGSPVLWILLLVPNFVPRRYETLSIVEGLLHFTFLLLTLYMNEVSD